MVMKIIVRPNPINRENFVLIKSEMSLISLGTEKMLSILEIWIDF